MSQKYENIFSELGRNPTPVEVGPHAKVPISCPILVIIAFMVRTWMYEGRTRDARIITEKECMGTIAYCTVSIYHTYWDEVAGNEPLSFLFASQSYL